MHVKQTLKNIGISFTALFTVIVLSTSVAPAANAATCGKDYWGNPIQTSVVGCSQSGNGSDITQSGLWGVLEIAITILTAGVGVAALAGIVFGIILYTTSSGDPAGIKKALEVLRNVAIGVIAYALMWSFLQWLIPGGIFS